MKRIREWLDDSAERRWDAQIEEDERAGRLDLLVEHALEEHRAGRSRPLDPSAYQSDSGATLTSA